MARRRRRCREEGSRSLFTVTIGPTTKKGKAREREAEAAAGTGGAAASSTTPAAGRGRGAGRLGPKKTEEEGHTDDRSIKEQLAELRKNFQLVAKGTLNNMQTNRSILGMLSHTFLGPRSKDFVRAGDEAGTAYFEQKPAAEGPPHLHIFAAVAEALAKAEEELGDISEEGGPITWKKIQAIVDSAGPLRVGETVRFFRITKAYSEEDEPELCKIDFLVKPLSDGTNCVSPAELQLLLCRTLLHAGYARKIGQAPRGPLERAIQALVKSAT